MKRVWTFDHFLFNYVDNYNKKETFPTENKTKSAENRKSTNIQIYADEQQRKKNLF